MSACVCLLYLCSTQVSLAENTQLFRKYKSACLLSDGELDETLISLGCYVNVLCDRLAIRGFIIFFPWNRPTFIEMFNLWWSILTTLPHLEWPMCPRGRTLTNSTWQQQCTNEMGQLVTNDGDAAHIGAFKICQVKENWVVFFLFFFQSQSYLMTDFRGCIHTLLFIAKK